MLHNEVSNHGGSLLARPGQRLFLLNLHERRHVDVSAGGYRLIRQAVWSLLAKASRRELDHAAAARASPTSSDSRSENAPLSGQIVATTSHGRPKKAISLLPSALGPHGIWSKAPNSPTAPMPALRAAAFVPSKHVMMAKRHQPRVPPSCMTIARPK